MTGILHRARAGRQRGAILVVVLLVMMSFAALASVLLFQSQIEYVVAINEQDHIKALGFAEAGLTWVEDRVMSATDYNSLLQGPDPNSTADDNLAGLRDLSLTATSQLNATNEGTKSAIVTRNFGNGNKNWEVIRMADRPLTSARKCPSSPWNSGGMRSFTKEGETASAIRCDPGKCAFIRS